MLPFLLNLSFFIKHYEILSWPPTCPAMYENAIIWRNQNKNALILCVWREVSRVHTFGPRVRNVNMAYSRDFFERVRSEKNIIEGALMTKRPYRGGGAVKLDSMWQHRLTRPLHVQHTYYRIIFKQNPFNIISRGVQGCTSTDFRLK